MCSGTRTPPVPVLRLRSALSRDTLLTPRSRSQAEEDARAAWWNLMLAVGKEEAARIWSRVPTRRRGRPKGAGSDAAKIRTLFEALRELGLSEAEALSATVERRLVVLKGRREEKTGKKAKQEEPTASEREAARKTVKRALKSPAPRRTQDAASPPSLLGGASADKK